MKRFYHSMRFFKSVSTARLPLKVRRVALKDFDGLCEKRDGYFLIKINNKLSESHSIDVLMHEIAHADSWSDGVEHPIDWAIAYRRLYNLWEKFIEDL